MLIKLTYATGPLKGTVFALTAAVVLHVTKAEDNVLQTVVITTINTGKGPLPFWVMESVEEVQVAVNEALERSAGRTL